MCTCFRLAHRYFTKQWQCFIVQDFMVINHTTVTSRGILAQAYVRNNQEIWHRCADGFDGLLYWLGHVPRRGTLLIFVCRNTKDFYTTHTKIIGLLRYFHSLINRQVILTWQCVDFFFDTFTRHDK